MTTKDPGGETFNPFTDRLSRDLRNDLSKGLLAALASGDPGRFRSLAVEYRKNTGLGADRSAYLAERLACYEAVMETAWGEHADFDRISVLLWNHELFFELHEFLEHRWMVVGGEEKLLLQALIRAAGTYVHRQYGRSEGAMKMAVRASETLVHLRTLLPVGFEADKLLAALADPKSPPPTFGMFAKTTHCRHSCGLSA